MPTTRCIDCNALTQSGTRCPDCRRKRDRARNQSRHDLYGPTYRARRRQVLDQATHCWICDKPLTSHPWPHPQSTSCDHVTPGNPESELRAAHLGCNASRRRTPSVTNANHQSD